MAENPEDQSNTLYDPEKSPKLFIEAEDNDPNENGDNQEAFAPPSQGSRGPSSLQIHHPSSPNDALWPLIKRFRNDPTGYYTEAYNRVASEAARQSEPFNPGNTSRAAVEEYTLGGSCRGRSQAAGIPEPGHSRNYSGGTTEEHNFGGGSRGRSHKPKGQKRRAMEDDRFNGISRAPSRNPNAETMQEGYASGVSRAPSRRLNAEAMQEDHFSGVSRAPSRNPNAEVMQGYNFGGYPGIEYQGGPYMSSATERDEVAGTSRRQPPGAPLGGAIDPENRGPLQSRYSSHDDEEAGGRRHTSSHNNTGNDESREPPKQHRRSPGRQSTFGFEDDELHYVVDPRDEYRSGHRGMGNGRARRTSQHQQDLQHFGFDDMDVDDPRDADQSQALVPFQREDDGQEDDYTVDAEDDSSPSNIRDPNCPGKPPKSYAPTDSTKKAQVYRQNQRRRMSQAGVGNDDIEELPRGRADRAGRLQQFNAHNTGAYLDPSRYSGDQDIPWGVNMPPVQVPQEEVSDAALIKRGLKRGMGNKVCKRGYGVNDPENIAIVNMYERDRLDFKKITEILNDKRIEVGKDPKLTDIGVHSRYNRTAPVIFKAQGLTFVPLAKRKKRGIRLGDDDPALGLPTNTIIWNKHLDIQLVKIEKEVEGSRWMQVAALFKQRTGQDVDAKQVADRWRAL